MANQDDNNLISFSACLFLYDFHQNTTKRLWICRLEFVKVLPETFIFYLQRNIPSLFHSEACRLWDGPCYLSWDLAKPVPSVHLSPSVRLSPLCTPSVLSVSALIAFCVTKYQQNLRHSKHARVQV